ncbi:MAG: ACP S-malonyltransferase [Luminiphilus sp.]|nr:ACP S-malonyltransferase [Luminiphilus sp.]
MSGYAFLFPGQGSQSVGMLSQAAEHYAVVGDTFAEASDALGYDLWALVSQGPEDQLTLTEFTQPAILTASVALYRCWQQEGGPSPEFVAGHSLGEYSALVIAGALSLNDGARLVQTRGRAMQSAVPAGEGAMAAVLGLSDAVIDEICVTHCNDTAYVGAVNYNSPGQVVIAGHAGAVESAGAFMKEAGAKRVLPLPVSAPFHTPLMQPAAAVMAEAFQTVELSDATVPVISNVDAQPHRKAMEIRRLLVRQVSEPVMWTQCVITLLEAGCTRFAECGPGKVLAGLLKRIDRSIQCATLEDPEALKVTATEAAR